MPNIDDVLNGTLFDSAVVEMAERARRLSLSDGAPTNANGYRVPIEHCCGDINCEIRRGVRRSAPDESVLQAIEQIDDAEHSSDNAS